MAQKDKNALDSNEGTVSMAEQMLKAECQSSFSIEKDGEKMVFTLSLTGLPQIIQAAILANGEGLTVELITAIMKHVGASHVERSDDIARHHASSSALN